LVRGSIAVNGVQMRFGMVVGWARAAALREWTRGLKAETLDRWSRTYAEGMILQKPKYWTYRCHDDADPRCTYMRNNYYQSSGSKLLLHDCFPCSPQATGAYNALKLAKYLSTPWTSYKSTLSSCGLVLSLQSTLPIQTRTSHSPPHMNVLTQPHPPSISAVHILVLSTCLESRPNRRPRIVSICCTPTRS
jgi:hypothetical protein